MSVPRHVIGQRFCHRQSIQDEGIGSCQTLIILPLSFLQPNQLNAPRRESGLSFLIDQVAIEA